MIDQATSFKITTWGRWVLNASGGITKTLRPTSGTGTSHCPLQAAHVALAEPRVDRKERHAGEVGR